MEKLCSASFGVPLHWICTSFGFELSDENMVHEGVEVHPAKKMKRFHRVVLDVKLRKVSRPTASERENSLEIYS